MHFGGDSENITIFGQSSGAAMVSALAISPTVPHNLFQRVIAQSGSIFGLWSYTTSPEFDARQIAKFAGLNPNLPIASLSQAFMSMDVYELLGAVNHYSVSVDLLLFKLISNENIVFFYLRLGTANSKWENREGSTVNNDRGTKQYTAGYTE